MPNKIQESDTGQKVFELLKILSKQEASYNELLDTLYQISKKDCSPETLQKYINTLKLTGLEITKSAKTGNYKLENKPFIINLSDEELETLCFLENYVSSLNNSTISYQFGNFVNNLSKYFSRKVKDKYKIKKSSYRTDYPKFNYTEEKERINIFEKYCQDSQKLEIEYKEKNAQTSVYIIEPKEIIYEKNIVYLLGYIPNNASNKKFLINNIVSYKQLPTKAANKTFLNTAVFECRGRLAKNYKLKPSEKIINSSYDTITVSNALEDKDILLYRILKYGENAKILQPQNLVDEMIKVLDKMIENCERSQN